MARYEPTARSSIPRRAGPPVGSGACGGLVALVALGALLVGVPLVLLRFGSWPITGVPTGEQIRDLPSTVVTDDAVIAILTVLLWVAWALFVASVLVEVVAQVRARAAARPGRRGRSAGRCRTRPATWSGRS